QLSSLNLKLKTIAGDGNCQFSSVADQLGESITPMFCREAAVSFIAGSKSHFLETVVGEHSATFDKKAAKNTLEELMKNPEAYNNAVFNDYLTCMSKSGHYGDHCTLYALACYFKVNIFVHELNHSPLSILDSSRTNTTMNCLDIV